MARGWRESGCVGLGLVLVQVLAACASHPPAEPPGRPDGETARSAASPPPRVLAEQPPPPPSEPLPDAVAEHPPKAPNSADVDCLLDPTIDRCKSPRDPRPVHASNWGLPERLGVADIKQGLSPVKQMAKACGPQHGVAPGTKVRVKITVEGATGHVRNAVATGDHANTPLGACVAARASQSRYKRFQKDEMGFIFTFRM